MYLACAKPLSMRDGTSHPWVYIYLGLLIFHHFPYPPDRHLCPHCAYSPILFLVTFSNSVELRRQFCLDYLVEQGILCISGKKKWVDWTTICKFMHILQLPCEPAIIWDFRAIGVSVCFLNREFSPICLRGGKNKIHICFFLFAK